MAVLSSLRRTPSALLTNPVLFVPVLVVMLFQVPQLALQSINPFLSSIVSLGFSLVFIAVMPFFQGGLIGMADEALNGQTSLQTFIDDGKSNYVSILVAYLALMAINFAVGMIAFFVAIFGGVFLFQSGGLQSANTAGLAVIGVIVAIVLFIYLLLIFFVQFYGQAIVLDDLDVVDGFKRSISVVRHHLVSTLGYSLIGAVIGGLAGIVFGAASIIMSPQSTTAFYLPEPSLPIIAGMGLVVLVGGTLFGGFFAVYSVSFYRAITQ
ncbi:hypothetical protein [Halobellus ordinarius]|uniref:DUF7847 domain-containing protein n=1 Tax=Halobellus ordinarius TaxID=3075120 RepID=UPI002880370C|nr:hypothetical protein [Halobellus sp. ZY16]